MAKDKDLISNKLIDKIIKASGNKHANVMSESIVMHEKDFISTPIPAINIALSGEIEGGLTPGLLMIAGPSKHFKTLYLMLIAKAYLDKYPNSVFILFDSEFGAGTGYFKSVGIDEKRVVHIPITNIEELKTQSSNVLLGIERGDKVFIGIDSIGNLASLKEVEDAIEGKSVADMTRAKQLKSLGRIITPQLTLKDIPLVVVNHTYKTLEMYSKNVVAGGTGLYYSSNDIWIIGRTQEKSTDSEKELLGYQFMINIEKSRTVKEKSQIPVNCSFETGIDRNSALLDIALEGGFITNPSKGKYVEKGKTTELKKAELGFIVHNLQHNEDFKAFVKDKYRQTGKQLVQDEMGEDDAD